MSLRAERLLQCSDGSLVTSCHQPRPVKPSHWTNAPPRGHLMYLEIDRASCVLDDLKSEPLALRCYHCRVWSCVSRLASSMQHISFCSRFTLSISFLSTYPVPSITRSIIGLIIVLGKQSSMHVSVHMVGATMETLSLPHL